MFSRVHGKERTISAGIGPEEQSNEISGAISRISPEFAASDNGLGENNEAVSNEN